MHEDGDSPRSPASRPAVPPVPRKPNMSQVSDVPGRVVGEDVDEIVEAVGEVLGLAEEQLAPSYDVLRDVGNCSSATVLLVLERLAQTVDAPPGGTRRREWP